MKDFIRVLYSGKPLLINVNLIETIRVNDGGQTIILTTNAGPFTLDEDFESVCQKIRLAQEYTGCQDQAIETYDEIVKDILEEFTDKWRYAFGDNWGIYNDAVNSSIDATIETMLEERK